ncbi:hypothetical protein E3N88_07113 [Mikania micrantha]|uniref:Retrotransposon gag domain-containing protein n=1 Tax=Mikania micrantha TaxID=192012 RepID=A0A5N6PSQ2_9ASTR|nr:hypothetical protein E3N88_07113 [Mikania micrantha]
MLGIDYERNRINEIENQGNGLIAVRDGPLARSFAARDENRESRLPNPVAPLKHKEGLGSHREAWSNHQPTEISSSVAIPTESKLLRTASFRRREHPVNRNCSISPTTPDWRSEQCNIDQHFAIVCDNMAGGTICQLRHIGLAFCVTGDCDPDNLPPLAPRKGQDFSGCDRLVSETPIMAGRRGGRRNAGGRGNINLTQAELNALINERVEEVLAAREAARNQNPLNQGANPNPPLCTFKMFLDCKPHSFSGTEGAVGLLRWIEKAESAFAMSNCRNEDRVKFAAGTFEGAALTWWNANVQNLGLDAANALPWDNFKQMLNREYCPRGEVQKLETEFWNHKMIGSERMDTSKPYVGEPNPRCMICHEPHQLETNHEASHGRTQPLCIPRTLNQTLMDANLHDHHLS